MTPDPGRRRPLTERDLGVRYFIVDAFTDAPFGGNPAAVCVLERPPDEEAMQSIAAEMNLSETAFVGAPGDDGARRLRWFTPAVEVSLCGHATLAAAHALLDEEGEDPPLRFSTASGELSVDREDDGRLGMDFPADPPEVQAPPAGLLEGLGCPSGVPTLRAGKLWIVRLGSPDEVGALEPDYGALSRVAMGEGPLGVSVTAPADGDDDFVSRFFAPWVGVDEDPVTGVAHTALTPYWAGELGRDELRARQISKREGRLGVRLEGDRVHLLGRAVVVARGRMRRPGRA